MDFNEIIEYQKIHLMGTSLFNKFEEIVIKKSKWDYYSEDRLMDGFSSIDSIFDNPGYFVRKYLDVSKKVLPDNLNELFKENSFQKRLYHTVSTFFLGLLLYEEIGVIRSNINTYLSGLEKKVFDSDPEQDYIDLPFSYYWFLTCFYHDFGYYMVKKHDLNFEILNRNKWDDVEIEGGKLLRELKNFGFNIPSFIKDSSLNYLRFSKKRFLPPDHKEHRDHGIISGLLYYNERKKRNKELFSLPENKGKVSCMTTDGQRSLHWSKYLFEIVHTSISWNIISHNMWFRKKIDGEDYIKEGLEMLITDEPLVKIKQYPMYFLLCLVDTIDPVKILVNDNPETIKENTLNVLQTTGFSIGSSINFTFDFLSGSNYDKYCKGIKDNEYWLGFLDYEDNTNKNIEFSITL